MKTTPATRGFTLVEALIVVALIGIVAVVTVPVLWSQAPVTLGAAAAEVGNALRFAQSEARRTGGHVLIDASSAGRLRVHASDASGAILGVINDPLKKTALDIDTSVAPWSGQIGLSARFFQGGVAYQRLLIAPDGKLEVFDGAINRGVLQAGSGMVLTLGAASATVAIDESSGRVRIP